MSRAHESLRARRIQLIARSDSLRREIRQDLGAMSGPLTSADRIFRVAGWFRIGAPKIVLGVGLAAALFGPTRVVRFVEGARTIWSAVQTIREQRARRAPPLP